MFNQRQWAELNAFTASFGANNGGQQNNSQPQAHQQHQHQHQEQQFQQSSAGNEHMVNHHQQPQPQPQSQPQPQVQPQYIQQPQPPQPQYQQPEQLPFQCDFSPQQEWPKFGFDTGTPSGNITAFQDHVRQNYFGSQSNEMDWTPSSDFSSGFDQGLETSHHGQQQQSAVKMEHEGINPAMNSYDHNHNGNQTSDTGRGVGNLISQFEQKDFQPPLPPRPNNNSIDNSVTSPIAIAHQQQPPPSHFHQFNAAPQGHSFAASSNPFTNSFTSHRVGTPSDTNFGSFGTSVSRVTSPIATSPPPAPFGSFHHDGSVVGSPSTAPTSDPFGSLDNFVNRPMGHHMQHGMPQSPAPTTPGHGTGTPGFAMWKAPAHEQPGTPQGFEHFHHQQQYPPQHHQPPLQQAHSLQRPMSRQHSIATSPGGYMAPPVPPKVKPTIGHANQFILELNPGKAKGKAPVKPPKPKPKPSLSLPLPTSVSMIKEEPQTPALPPTPFMPEVAIKRAETPSESSTPRPSIVARPSRDQVPAESWESWKPTIHDLYLEQRKPLKEVMSIMAEQYNFQATPKMYKTRFSQWGFVKNNTEDEVKKLLSMKFQRDSQGKVSEFVRNGKIVNLSTYLKRKGVTEYDLVDFEIPNNLPSHIRCRTPTPPPAPEYLKSPDLVRAQETIVSNIRKAFLQCRQWELETERHVGWPSTMVWGAPSSEMLTEANFYFEAGDADSGGQCLMNAFNQLEIDLKQLSPQAILEMLFGMVRRDPGLMTALCKYVGAFSTTNYDRAHPLRQIFTCLYDVQQKHGAATLSDLLWGSSPLIAEELESIYGRRHPYVARTWIDMATFYDQKTPDRLQKLAQELTLQHRQLSQSQGTDFSDLLALRYAMAQLLYAADPENDAAKQAAKDLLDDMKGAKLLHRVRGSKNTYCYHCAVKNDPWTKRCRRRYDSIVELLEKHTDTKILPYFEEDFHTQEHEPESQPQAQPQQAQNAWAAAMGMGSNRWGFL